MVKGFTRIAAMGVELEGGWNTKPEARMVSDGSLSGFRNSNFMGELPSPPFSDPKEMEAWMRRNYPTETNSTCGMHVHVSFKNRKDYLRFMSRVAFDHIHKELLAWGKRANIKNEHFWSRLDGCNTYCKPDYLPMKQVKHRDKGGSRYSMLNYCYGRYGTMELRVLPLFKEVDVGVAAVMAYASILERYLAKRRSLASKSEMVILEDAPVMPPEIEYERETLIHEPDGFEMVTLEDACV